MLSNCLWNRTAIHHLGLQLEEVRLAIQVSDLASTLVKVHLGETSQQPSVKYAVGKWLENLYFYHFSIGFLSGDYVLTCFKLIWSEERQSKYAELGKCL